jgi:hypothetical protein
MSLLFFFVFFSFLTSSSLPGKSLQLFIPLVRLVLRPTS